MKKFLIFLGLILIIDVIYCGDNKVCIPIFESSFQHFSFGERYFDKSYRFHSSLGIDYTNVAGFWETYPIPKFQMYYEFYKEKHNFFLSIFDKYLYSFKFSEMSVSEEIISEDNLYIEMLYALSIGGGYYIIKNLLVNFCIDIKLWT